MQNIAIDGKFKIINPIYDSKNFVEEPLEIRTQTCNDKSYIPEESVNTASINSKNENSDNGSYREINKSFTNEHINSVDPNKTASNSNITINSIEHHLSDSITSLEHLNGESCDCIIRLNLKD